MRIAALFALCATLGSCASPAARYGRDFVRSDARSDAANIAAELCTGEVELIEGREGLYARDYRCHPSVPPEVERWLSGYMEVTIMKLKTRNVRLVGSATCGEASFELNGAQTRYRPFAYVPDGDSIFATEAALGLPDSARCPVSDEILTICAPTAAEREAAGLRHTRCEMRTPL
jgi:hypothetical protein